MPSVLRNPDLSETAHRLGTSAVDPRLTACLEEARRAGYDEGFTAGAGAGEAITRKAEAEALARIERAVAAATGALRAELSAFCPELTRLAVRIARRLVAEVPEAVSAGLSARIAAALDQIDDEDLVIHLHPDDAARLRTLTHRLDGLTVQPDPDLSPGDARITGRWSRADLTLATAWGIVEEQVCG